MSKTSPEGSQDILPPALKSLATPLSRGRGWQGGQAVLGWRQLQLNEETTRVACRSTQLRLSSTWKISYSVTTAMFCLFHEQGFYTPRPWATLVSFVCRFATWPVV